MEMLLDAQNRNEDALAVIGPNPKAFCDSIVEALPPMSRLESALCTLRDGVLAAAVLAAIWLVFGVLQGVLGGGSWPLLTITLGQLISGTGIMLASCGFVYWVCRHSFSAQEKKGPAGLGVFCAVFHTVRGNFSAPGGFQHAGLGRYWHGSGLVCYL
ncbi:MAG: hypothetical protein MSH10_03870 [Pygmaiobacter massiliensis]|nr:hypothetical protein [Pygmaiobacter massiliensis]